MPRIARIEAVGYPYHVIQRGNRNQRVFINEGDNRTYLNILKNQSELFGLEVWAYCLMVNHIHLVVMPKHKGSLTKCISQTHQAYTRMINFREGWKGHLWQGRFQSYPMDEKYLWAAVRYVERNPVRAGIVDKAEDYFWSSANIHVQKKTDNLLSRFYLMDEIKDWKVYLSCSDDQQEVELLKAHQSIGRPLGNEAFIDSLEAQEGRKLTKQKPGPKGNPGDWGHST
jgi:putative transposase